MFYSDTFFAPHAPFSLQKPYAYLFVHINDKVGIIRIMDCILYICLSQEIAFCWIIETYVSGVVVIFITLPLSTLFRLVNSSCIPKVRNFKQKTQQQPFAEN